MAYTLLGAMHFSSKTWWGYSKASQFDKNMKTRKDYYAVPCDFQSIRKEFTQFCSYKDLCKRRRKWEIFVRYQTLLMKKKNSVYSYSQSIELNLKVTKKVTKPYLIRMYSPIWKKQRCLSFWIYIDVMVVTSSWKSHFK